MTDGDRKVRDIMLKEVRTAAPQTPAVQAAQMMVRYGIRHLVVTDGVQNVVGVLSQRILLKQLSPWLTRVKTGYEPPMAGPAVEVREIMSAPAITITEDATIREAARLLAEHKIGCLPVIGRPQGLVGIVSAIDVLRTVAGDQLQVPEEEFQPFLPPALLKEDGTLTLPAVYSPGARSEGEVLAVLASSTDGRRIGVKLFAAGQETPDETEERLGARPVTLADGYLVIPVQDFLQVHKIGIRGQLRVTKNRSTGYLVLSPLSSS